MKRPIVALMYDFDRTLCTKDMQEYGFIESVGMSANEFWKEVNEFTDTQGMDNILAYMFKMKQKAELNGQKITRETFNELGKNIEYFGGVDTWFDRINAYGAEIGVQIEHYIVSSGIKEIVEGAEIARFFKKIYACEFLYDDDGSILWPKFAVNYTAKTQFLFRINKNILEIDSHSTSKLNKYTPHDDRRIPFRNMIYIGDGMTDVPCMKLVKSFGGQSIAVYDLKNSDKSSATELKKDDRVNFIAPADYTHSSEIEMIVQSIIRKIKSVEEMMSYN